MKKDLIKAGSPRQHQLVVLAREINAREDVIQAHREKTVAAASAWMCEVMLQGQALLKAKANLTHGMWMDWLRIHCPLISQSTANAYMRVATNFSQRAANLSEVTSLRAALFLCAASEGDTDGDGQAESRSWPPYLEAISRVGKILSFVTRHPLKDWPDEGRDKLRTDLQPLAAALWPERFR